jgi:hypothetical protein
MKILVSGKTPKLKDVKDSSRYSKVGTYKGQPVYARRIRYEGKSGKTVRKAFSYRQKKDVVYDPQQKRYRQVSNEKLTVVETIHGPKQVNLDQLKHLYKKQGSVYAKKQRIALVEAKKPADKLPRATQVILKVRFTIDGKKYVVYGQSHTNPEGRYSMSESIRQAVNKAKSDLMETYGIDYEQVREAKISIIGTEYRRVVS